MYVSEEMIDEMKALYGHPHEASFRFDVSDKEFNLIKASQKHGRMHDVTLYILKDNKVVVIAKPFYPPGLYRAPSGGLQPGESFQEGIDREVWEETGCEIELEKFLLYTQVTFYRNGTSDTGNDSTIPWTSLVFHAKYVRGEFAFTDHREIREVRLAAPIEFDTFSQIMRDSTVGGLHYRAALHDTVKVLLPLFQ